VTDTTNALPCPFCGGESHMTFSQDGDSARIICNAWPTCMGSGAWEKTRENAIAAWNRRALLSAAPVEPIYMVRVRNCNDMAWVEHGREYAERVRGYPDQYEVRVLYAAPLSPAPLEQQNPPCALEPDAGSQPAITPTQQTQIAGHAVETAAQQIMADLSDRFGVLDGIDDETLADICSTMRAIIASQKGGEA
jgi:Lar family restriction alleviation protein